MEYEVIFKQIEIYRHVIDADSEKEAKRIMSELLELEENKFKYHNDSDAEIEAYEI